MSVDVGWRRELPDGAAVVLDGRMTEWDPDGSETAPVRVVLEMPEYIADAVAHALYDMGEMAERYQMERSWLDARECATALFAAVRAAGYRCPDLPEGVSVE